MRDVVVCIIVLLYMIGGCFVVDKIGDFLDNNYKRFDADNNEEEIKKQ